MKKSLMLATITIVSGIIIYLCIDLFVGLKHEKTNSNSNSNNEIKTQDTIIIDYEMYQKLRSEIHEEDTFAILIMDSSDDISSTFKEEVLYSFKGRKSLIYEIDIDKLSDVDMSSVINDISGIQKYKEPTIIDKLLEV